MENLDPVDVSMVHVVGSGLQAEVPQEFPHRPPITVFREVQA